MIFVKLPFLKKTSELYLDEGKGKLVVIERSGFQGRKVGKTYDIKEKAFSGRRLAKEGTLTSPETLVYPGKRGEKLGRWILCWLKKAEMQLSGKKSQGPYCPLSAGQDSVKGDKGELTFEKSRKGEVCRQGRSSALKRVADRSVMKGTSLKKKRGAASIEKKWHAYGRGPPTRVELNEGQRRSSSEKKKKGGVVQGQLVRSGAGGFWGGDCPFFDAVEGGVDTA